MIQISTIEDKLGITTLHHYIESFIDAIHSNIDKVGSTSVTVALQ